MTRPLTVVIGHDYREQEPYDVCEFSLRRRSSRPLNVVRLQERDLRLAGIYNRPYRVDEAGQFHDERDGRPFSVAFSFARFLTPLVARSNGCPSGFALFVDCDFLFQRDVAELFALADPSKAVQVVKHNFQPPRGVKMDGVAQQAYHRKCWSAAILWNLDHEANDALTPRQVNVMPGRYLHALEWLPDDLIGGLPEEWHWIAGHSPTLPGAAYPLRDIGAIHYTDGGPWFADRQGVQFADRYVAERDAMERARAEERVAAARWGTAQRGIAA